MTFYRKRWFWVLAGVLLIGGGLYAKQRNASAGPFYETQAVERGTLRQTVEVTGQVVPQARITLSFPQGGKLSRLSVKVGDRVKDGQLLAQTDARDLSFAAQRANVAVSIAGANLRAREAGETKESIQIAQASLDQAKANHKKSQIDLDNAKITVEDDYRVSVLATDTAQKNLDNALATNNLTVNNGYETLRNTLQASLASSQTALSDGDLLIGVDNASESYRYLSVLSIGDSGALGTAKQQYTIAKLSRAAAVEAVSSLSISPTVEQVRQAAEKTRKALEEGRLFMDAMQRVLTATVPSINFPSSEIATKKSTLDADRAALSTQLAAVISGLQTVGSSELSRTTNLDQLRNTLETAKTNQRIAENNKITKIRSAEIAVEIQQAAVVSAEAALAAKKVGPREVDLAALRAQVADAQTAAVQAGEKLRDAQIVAPANGVIAEIMPKQGEQLAPSAPVILLIADDRSMIEALVPENDIAKIALGQSVDVTFEAFNEDIILKGKVAAENPDQTKVQDAVYYKVSILLDEQSEQKVKPGMTVNVSILTAEKTDALFIPSRAIREQEGQKSVQVEQGGQAMDRAITTGLRADEGRVELLNGLQVGEMVIVGELTPDEYAKRQAENK